ncbi:MAG: hypothetical protein RI996_190 [Candidatus Parcubacteria bacterium]|jgi:hypothetical protein
MKKSKKSPREYDTHHRRPRSLGGGNDSANLSDVPKVLHQAWHTLFSNKNPFQIARIINRYWLDPKYKMLVVETRPIYAAYTKDDMLKAQRIFTDAYAAEYARGISGQQLIEDTNAFVRSGTVPNYAKKYFNL